MSDKADDKLSPGEQPPVKKRSLSSYLSNVNNRKEELEKIAAQMNKDKKVQPTDGTAQDNNEEATNAALDTNVISGRDPEILHNVITENNGMDRIGELKTQESTVSKIIEKPNVEINYQMKSIADQDSNRNECISTIENEDQPTDQPVGKEETVNTDAAIKGSFSRNDLKNMLTQLEEKKRGLSKSQEPLDHADDEDSELSEVESDAPTEPASPPRPRRGRLVRADQLRSSPSRKSPKIHSSDSELSDIEDMNNIPISSSILHGDSSPEKAHQTQLNSSPVTTLKRESSKLKRHIAVPKVSRSKKSVHRDAGGRTRLQVACDKGKYEFAKKLIEEGYEVNDQDNAGNSPLHEAALNGHFEIVELLLNHGADVNIQSFDPVKDTPLIDASANGHLDIVKLLLKHGADPTIVNAKGLTAIESIEEDEDLEEHEMEIVKKIKHTLKKSMQTYKQLTDRRGIRSSSNQRSPDRERSSSNVRMEEEFYWTDTTSKVGKEKLLKASKEGRLPYVGAYLENGGRPDFRSFLEAVKFGHEDIASIFLAFGAQVNMSSREGQTPLMIAVGRGHTGTVKLLLDAGADPIKRDKYGRSALSYAKSSELGFKNDEEIDLIKKALKKKTGHSDEEEEITATRSHDSDTELRNDNSKQDSENDSDMGKVSRKRKTASPASPAPQKKQHIIDSTTKSNSQTSKSTWDFHRRDGVSSNSTPADRTASKKIKRESSPSPGATAIPHRSQSATPITSVTPKPVETAEEKEQRLKAEEQYRMRRLLHKKKKEQELLQKLELDEQKRLEDRKRQQKEEELKLEREKLMEEQKQILLRNQAEIERRHRIRAQYPLGLKLIDFENKSDYQRYLPLYYVMIDGVKRVLDLQICIILKDTDINENFVDKIEITLPQKEQLWNVYQFIFLRGGNGPGSKYTTDFDNLPLESRINIKRAELAKFLALPLHWIPWDLVSIPNEKMKGQIQDSMIQLDLLDFSRPQADQRVGSSVPTNSAFSTPQLKEALPLQFQNRSVIIQFFKNASPQW
ncbi:LAFE_0E11650g1_1 [Lachancea fermentati]|uniref:LAFE_0E11650g1_1 n=1 Tax=Lachancea fermentati TaxID=4955 RepID=A0A1G4MDM2_LACFM|nr:LAFE_0E11650g1_1 [Lachancea fermentati]